MYGAVRPLAATDIAIVGFSDAREDGILPFRFVLCVVENTWPDLGIRHARASGATLIMSCQGTQHRVCWV